MDKRTKQQRRKTPDEQELEDAAVDAPRGASFDTEEGRSAQGMRPDIGAGPSEQEKRRDEPIAPAEEPKRFPEEPPKK